MKAIQIYDGNKYSDESHFKLAMDTFTDIRSILYNWVSTPFSVYLKYSVIKYQINSGGVTIINGRAYVKRDFRQFIIRYSPKSKIWNSFKEIK